MWNNLGRFLYANFFTAMDRLIYRQLLVNYALGLAFFSSIIMINELYYIIRYYFEQNVPLIHVFSMIGALIPFLISFSIPFGVLPAYLLFFGKLSQDSEITAMRACGFSHFRIMWPGILFGLAIMFFSYNFKNTAEAKANSYFLQLKAKVLSQKPVIQLLDNVFLSIGGVQISFQSSTKDENGDDILNTVYAVDVRNKRTIRSRQARIYVNPDNPEHYIIRFLNGDMNQLTTPPIRPVTNETEPAVQRALPVLPQAFSATNEGTVGIVVETPDTNTASNQEPAQETQVQDAQPVEAPPAQEQVLSNAPPAEGEPDLPPPTPEPPKEEFYLSSFGAMTMNNYVTLPDDGFYRSPETMSVQELRASIYADENNRRVIEQMKKATQNKKEIDRLYLISKYAPTLLLSAAEDEIDQLKTLTFAKTRTNEIALEKQNADSLYKAVLSQQPNLSFMRLHEKFMLPVSAFVFALLALPLGLFGARSGRGEGLSISLVVTLVFYGFKSAVENAISNYTLPPSGMWLPILVFGLIAVALYTRKVLE